MLETFDLEFNGIQHFHSAHTRTERALWESVWYHQLNSTVKYNQEDNEDNPHGVI